MIENIDEIIDNITYVILSINILVFLIGLKKNKKNKSYFYFTTYLLTTGIIQALTFYLARTFKYNGIGNLFLSHYYFISQFILLSFFYKSLFGTHQKRLVDVLMLVVLSVLAVRLVINPSIYFRFDLFETFICGLPLVIYSIIHLYNSLSKSKAYLYINAAVLIYLSTSTLIFILGNYLSNKLKSEVDAIWMINSILYLIFLVLIFIEWYKNFRPTIMKS